MLRRRAIDAAALTRCRDCHAPATRSAPLRPTAGRGRSPGNPLPGSGRRSAATASVRLPPQRSASRRPRLRWLRWRSASCLGLRPGGGLPPPPLLSPPSLRSWSAFAGGRGPAAAGSPPLPREPHPCCQRSRCVPAGLCSRFSYSCSTNDLQQKLNALQLHRLRRYNCRYDVWQMWQNARRRRALPRRFLHNVCRMYELHRGGGPRQKATNLAKEGEERHT